MVEVSSTSYLKLDQDYREKTPISRKMYKWQLHTVVYSVTTLNNGLLQFNCTVSSSLSSHSNNYIIILVYKLSVIENMNG